MNLKLDYELIRYPYESEAFSDRGKWSKINLKLIDNEGKLIRQIIDIQWDINVFAEWIRENKDALRYENIPIGMAGQSIAHVLFQFYENLDPKNGDETLLDRIYQYRERHGLRFALRGTDVKDVYIGMFKGLSTISLYDDEEQWNYTIDMNQSIQDILHIIDEIKNDNL